jgi:hypothetical protein
VPWRDGASPWGAHLGQGAGPWPWALARAQAQAQVRVQAQAQARMGMGMGVGARAGIGTVLGGVGNHNVTGLEQGGGTIEQNPKK